MAKKFYAVNKETGERWKPEPNSSYYKEYLVMYDSGCLAVVKEDFYTYITPLDRTKWQLVVKENMKNLIK